ncbi:MAG: sugar ABC transporter ATP-binding protein [Sphaerochaetaceae bacterium]|nr:sugar ABC transporter ATP-binding protein [Sphaerochaetaceae bacterium]
MDNYILELRGVSKTFPGVRALDNVRFDLRPGEIHSIMGENGAGKSTFIKIITGVYIPDEGEMLFNGKPVTIQGTNDSQKLGIAAIYQHVTSYPDLSVTENIFIGHEIISKRTKRLLWNQMHAKAKDLLEQLGASFDPKIRMGTLSVAQQQIVEIAKALSVHAKVIIMDEPTAALSNRESEELYRITKKLRDDGVAVIFISHRMEDFERLADRVTVLRDAQYIGTWDKEEMDHDRLVMAMVGREITQMFPKREVTIKKEIFRVEGLGRHGVFKDISFTLHQGEILALTGLVGAGRTEVCESIYGITPFDEGSLWLNGKHITIGHPHEALAKGIGYLPEDRLGQGLILDWELYKNVTLPVLDKFSQNGVLDTHSERERTKEIIELLAVKATSVFDKAATLSGGNQQKLIVAKLLTADLKVIILDEPTKGVDVGAKTAIFNIMGDLAQRGYGIIMVSSEMVEVLGVSDRTVVMKEGRIAAIFETAKTTQEQILRAALGTSEEGLDA